MCSVHRNVFWNVDAELGTGIGDSGEQESSE
jgi:hypothetical protein